RRVRREQEGMAVRAGAGDLRRADDAERAGAVLDDEGAAELVGEGAGEEAPELIGTAARGIGDDDADGAAGIVLGVRGRGGEEGGTREKRAAAQRGAGISPHGG